MFGMGGLGRQDSGIWRRPFDADAVCSAFGLAFRLGDAFPAFDQQGLAKACRGELPHCGGVGVFALEGRQRRQAVDVVDIAVSFDLIKGGAGRTPFQHAVVREGFSGKFLRDIVEARSFLFQVLPVLDRVVWFVRHCRAKQCTGHSRDGIRIAVEKRGDGPQAGSGIFLRKQQSRRRGQYRRFDGGASFLASDGAYRPGEGAIAFSWRTCGVLGELVHVAAVFLDDRTGLGREGHGRPFFP